MFGPATREEALSRLAEFLPRAGKAFSQRRGYDLGPTARHNVSLLSPYLRYRLLGDSEVAAAVIELHGPKDSEPFLKEMLRRSYSRGWLEGRPQVYLAYRRSLADDWRRFSSTAAYQAAIIGQTGISAFDSWNQELLDQGYLHHQARAWYASIWIFSLRLPWTLGAAHFQRHLLDADPASNTLGWRQVAGLHTPGKHVLARADEIAKMTDGRFQLKGRLNESALSLTGPPAPPAHWTPWPQKPSELLGERYALLVTPDDLTSELGALSELKSQCVVVCGNEHLEEDLATPKVRAFLTQAFDDAKARLRDAFDCPIWQLPVGSKVGAELGQRLTSEGVPHLVYYQPFVGPWLELLTQLTSRDVGLRYFPLRRAWDAQLFPLAAKSYLQFQKDALALVLKRKGQV